MMFQGTYWLPPLDDEDSAGINKDELLAELQF